jgi:GlcNAc-P-P-Und epimerase
LYKTVVIFGGAGFIGRHLACHLLENKLAEKVVAADSVTVSSDVLTKNMQKWFETEHWEHKFCDVRVPIGLMVDGSVDLIFNLAAVHREPGHAAHEYYETNLPGATNVCEWAEASGCENIVFTSSIAPYGPTEDEKDEGSIPTPVTAYGGAKLAAEKIHETWQARSVQSRRLIVVRPGVVFGAGEGGNVSRLVKAVIGHYFVYMGNQEVRKAGVYVKELCFAMMWMLEDHRSPVALFNMSMNPAPSVRDYIEGVCKVKGIARRLPRVPFILVLIVSYLVFVPFRLLTGKDTFNPARVRKLVRSNNIKPQVLINFGYTYKFDLEAALVDWKNEMPAEW